MKNIKIIFLLFFITNLFANENSLTKPSFNSELSQLKNRVAKLEKDLHEEKIKNGDIFDYYLCFNQSKHLISSSTTIFNFLHFLLLGSSHFKKSTPLVFVDPNMLCISDHVSKVLIEVTILILTDVA